MNIRFSPQVVAAFVSGIAVSHLALAEPLSEQTPESGWAFGLDNKIYALALPSHTQENDFNFGGDGDVYGMPSALGLSVSKQVNEYVAIIGEMAMGYEEGSAGTSTSIGGLSTGRVDASEDYKTALDYSASVLAQLCPFGDSGFRPYLVAGLNTTSITYDYEIESNIISRPIKGSETLSSTGLVYGLGFEFYIWDKLEFKLDYQALPHMEETTDVISFGLNYEL